MIIYMDNEIAGVVNNRPLGNLFVLKKCRKKCLSEVVN